MFGSKKKKDVSAFEKLTFSLSAMRYHHEYVITRDGDNATLEFYNGYFRHDEERESEKTVSLSAAEIVKLLKDCGVDRWDGFSGKNPRGMLDGIMFNFTADLGEEGRIYASGSNNFPRGYSDFRDALEAIIRD